MKDQKLTKRIEKWILAVGRSHAEERLLNVGISLTMAQKLLAGCYPYQPKIDKILLIEKAMK
jgi:hypothetical protein